MYRKKSTVLRAKGHVLVIFLRGRTYEALKMILFYIYVKYIYISHFCLYIYTCDLYLLISRVSPFFKNQANSYLNRSNFFVLIFMCFIIYIYYYSTEPQNRHLTPFSLQSIPSDLCVCVHGAISIKYLLHSPLFLILQ